ncbi:hypothetical protein N0V90_005112 [Kalmusia sp. IMI 367209]|nr:hypothetical protein N0V90_005112 [Kalmusia sp. IMI 367209]
MAKGSIATVALFALLQSAAAHYYFPHLVINGEKTPEFKYVRDVAPNPDGTYDDPDGYNGKEAPVYGDFENTYMTDVRCGRDGAKSASTTETADIEAGSDLAFHIKEFNDPQYNNGIFHPGPAQVYMSKSDDLSTDAGDGDWFKIYYLGPSSDTTWATDRQVQINFTIPETTPPGTCTPGPTIKIPDDYSVNDPGIGLTTEGVEFNSGLDKYQPPGPAVWTG